MADQALPPHTQEPAAGAPRRRALLPLAAVAIVAVAGGGAGAYFGLRGVAGPGSGPGVSPPARAFAAAAYDEASHQVVLFGGIGANGAALDDTWTWNGSSWTQQHPATSPPAREFAAMTYDPKAHDVVLVGGRSVNDSSPTVCSGGISAGGPNATPGVARPPVACEAPPNGFSDTWVWDGSTWRLAGAAPPVLFGASPALGTDPTTGQVLMFGESPAALMSPACPVPAPSFPPGTPIPQVAIPCMTSPTPSPVAWVWSGTSWVAVTAGAPPSEPGLPLGGPAALAADPTSGHLVDIRPGISCGGPVSPAVAVPCPLLEGSSGVSSSSGSAVMPPASGPNIGGESVPPLPQASATAGTASPMPIPVGLPPTAVPVPMPTGIPSPGRVTCCAGSISTWSGSAWSSPKRFSNGPQVRASGIAGDPAQHEMVAVTPQGTWTWNGSTWKAEHPPTSPPAAEGGSLVYDGASGRLLLFGGEPTPTFKSSNPGSQPPLVPVSDELWAWDGTTWSQLSGAKAAPAQSLPPAPTPTFVPPITAVPGSPAPTRVPLPTPRPVPCTPNPAPTETPTPTPVQGTGSGAGSGSSCGPILVPPTSG